MCRVSLANDAPLLLLGPVLLISRIRRTPSFASLSTLVLSIVFNVEEK